MTADTAARGYRPGTWFGILGEHATVVLPPSEKARVAGLWSLIDDGAGFDVVLDALISGGLRDLPGFVLVSTVDDETRVVVRGPARARLTTGGETVEVAGEGVTTWAERTLTDVSGIRLLVGADESDGPAYLIDRGLVRVSEVVAPADPDVAAADARLAADADQPAAPPPPVGTPSGPPPPVLPAEPAAHDGAVGGDHDGMTHAGHPWPVPEPDPGAATPPVAKLVFSHGDEVEVDRAVLVGRAPEARRFTSGDQPRLVTVPSPAHEISSSHLEIRPGSGADQGSAVVTDLGSTNGTVLVQPGLAPEDLRAGIAVPLVPGAIIDLGDGLTIQVVDP